MYNKDMKKGRLKKGFTIIEVALFLAISGALFAMVMSNTAINVARRRYNDTVNDFVEELKNAYSATINVENYRRNTEDSSFFCSISSAFNNSGGLVVNSPTTGTGKTKTDNLPGRSRCAVYGQVVVIRGYKGTDNIDTTEINRYDLIGLALEKDYDPEGDDDVIASLRDYAKANIVTMKSTNGTYCSAGLAGTSSRYTPQSTGRLENQRGRGLYNGAIMITRSPISGTIHTYFYVADTSGLDDNGSFKDTPEAYADAFNVQKWLNSTSPKSCGGFYNNQDYFVRKAILEGKMKKNGNLEVCVGSEDLYAVGNKRRAIRIHGDGSTESAVELLTESESVSICKEK